MCCSTELTVSRRTCPQIVARVTISEPHSLGYHAVSLAPYRNHFLVRHFCSFLEKTTWPIMYYRTYNLFFHEDHDLHTKIWSSAFLHIDCLAGLFTYLNTNSIAQTKQQPLWLNFCSKNVVHVVELNRQHSCRNVINIRISVGCTTES